MQFPVNAPFIWGRNAGTQQAIQAREGQADVSKACTRCSGDAYADFSEYEPEWRCLQCGRTVPPASLFNEDEAWLAA